MKKMIVLIAINCCWIFHSCEPSRGDALNIKRVYFNNITSHIIKLLPYKNGLVIKDSVKVFLPNSITILESQKYKSLTASTDFDFKYQRVTDSIIVKFDDSKKEKHLFGEIFLPNKERCIETNFGGAYNVKIIEQRKNFIEVEFTYTFTEQDYLDAEFIK